MDPEIVNAQRLNDIRAGLLVMAKRPTPGQTKSRLTPPLSAETAAGLYKAFLLDALDLARSVPGVVPMIAYSPPTAAAYFRELAPDLQQVPQIGATLGDRLDYVLTHCIERNYGYVVAMNSDSPTLPEAYLAQAFKHLAAEDTDVVLGPCEDGGYYLIGWKQPHPALVQGVRMSTNHVLDDTMTLAASQNLRVSLTPTWYDVDDIADLDRLAAELKSSHTLGHHTRAFLAKGIKNANEPLADYLRMGKTS